ncbi:MAG: aldehyde dehydrogenase family protein, partial [Pseudonocardia sp.]|nr:aldehyde dehydrogenase family protein [Pseudonocardia sp.]
MTRDDWTQVLQAAPTGLYIDGEWREASGGGTITVHDPGTGDPLRDVADATPGDALAALDAAEAAAPTWAATPPRERGEILRRCFQAMHEHIDELALLCTLEMGKSLAESRGEVAYA